MLTLRRRSLRAPGVGAPAAAPSDGPSPTLVGRRDVAACAVLAAVTLAFFAPVLAGQTSSTVPLHQFAVYPWAGLPAPATASFPQTDEADTYYPWQSFVSRSLRDGDLPLWNPHSFAGSPFMVNGQNGALYPPRAALALTVSPSWAHDLFVMAHVFMAGVAMYALLRLLGCRPLSATFGGIAWMLYSNTIAWMPFDFMGPIAVFLPTSILCVVALARRPTWPRALATGLSLALLLLGGQVQLAVMAWLFVSVFALGAVARAVAAGPGHPPLWSTAARFALVPVVAVGASAVVLLPTALAAGELGRQPYAYSALVTEFDTPLTTYLGAWWPGSLPLTADKLLSSTVFVGTPTAVLALVGAVVRRKGSGLGGAAAVGTVLLTVGTPLTWAAYHLIPGFGFLRPLGRLQFLFGFGVAVLAALGLDALTGTVARRPGRAFRRGAPVLAAACLAVTTAQLLWYGRQVTPPFSPRQAALLYPPTELIGALERDARSRPVDEPQRFLPLTRTPEPGGWFPPVLYASQPMVFGLDSAGGYDSIVPDRVVDLWRVVGGDDPDSVFARPLQSAFVASFPAGTTRLDMLDRVGVTTLVAPAGLEADPAWSTGRFDPVTSEVLYRGPEGVVLDLAGAQEAAWVVFQAEAAATPRDALRRFADPAFDHRAAVILEREASSAALPPLGNSSGDALAVRRDTNSVSVDVSSNAEGWLVLADSWAPGWEAQVNGRSATVERANYAFRAVRIPAGRSTVSLSYRPPGLAVGAITSGVTWAASGVVLLAVLIRWRRRPAAEAVPKP